MSANIPTAQHLYLGFEFYPPQNLESQALVNTVDMLASHFSDIDAFSITHGAGGSEKERTLATVAWLQSYQPVRLMPHVVCAGQSERALGELVDHYHGQGINTMLALAGDDVAEALPSENGGRRFTHAIQLVELMRSRGDITVAVAANPEPHPLSNVDNLEADRVHLADKLALAHMAITQFFFQAPDYWRLVDDMQRRRVTTPIIPGIMMSTNPARFLPLSRKAGVTVPNNYRENLLRASEADSKSGTKVEVRKVVIDFVSVMCQNLLDSGVPGFHFFTLNQTAVTREILANVGLFENQAANKEASFA